MQNNNSSTSLIVSSTNTTNSSNSTNSINDLQVKIDNYFIISIISLLFLKNILDDTRNRN
jgi:hypothetical protein